MHYYFYYIHNIKFKQFKSSWKYTQPAQKYLFFYYPYFVGKTTYRLLQVYRKNFFYKNFRNRHNLLGGFLKKPLFIKKCRILFYKYFFFNLKNYYFKILIKLNKCVYYTHLFDFFFATLGFYLVSRKFIQIYLWILPQYQSVIYVNQFKNQTWWKQIPLFSTIQWYWNDIILSFYINYTIYNFFFFQNYVFQQHYLLINQPDYYINLWNSGFYDMRNSLIIVVVNKMWRWEENLLNFKNFSIYGWKVLN